MYLRNTQIKQKKVSRERGENTWTQERRGRLRQNPRHYNRKENGGENSQVREKRNKSYTFESIFERRKNVRMFVIG